MITNRLYNSIGRPDQARTGWRPRPSPQAPTPWRWKCEGSCCKSCGKSCPSRSFLFSHASPYLSLLVFTFPFFLSSSTPIHCPSPQASPPWWWKCKGICCKSCGPSRSFSSRLLPLSFSTYFLFPFLQLPFIILSPSSSAMIMMRGLAAKAAGNPALQGDLSLPPPFFPFLLSFIYLPWVCFLLFLDLWSNLYLTVFYFQTVK